MTNYLIELLETLGFDVIQQGTLDQEEECPTSYFTIYNWDNPRTTYYNNKHRAVEYNYQIQFYSQDFKMVDEIVDKAVQLLEENGFLIDEEPTDDYSDRKDYIAKSFDVTYEKRGK